MFSGIFSSPIRSDATVLLTVNSVDDDEDEDEDDDDDGDSVDDDFCVIFFAPLVSRSLRFSGKCFCLFSGCCALGFTTDSTDCAFNWLFSIDVLVVGDTMFDLPLLSVVSVESLLHFVVSCSIRRLF